MFSSHHNLNIIELKDHFNFIYCKKIIFKIMAELNNANRTYASVLKDEDQNKSEKIDEKETEQKIGEEKVTNETIDPTLESKADLESKESYTIMGVIKETGKDVALLALMATDYAAHLMKEGTDYASQKVHEATESLIHKLEDSSTPQETPQETKLNDEETKSKRAASSEHEK